MRGKRCAEVDVRLSNDAQAVEARQDSVGSARCVIIVHCARLPAVPIIFCEIHEFKQAARRPL